MPVRPALADFFAGEAFLLAAEALLAADADFVVAAFFAPPERDVLAERFVAAGRFVEEEEARLVFAPVSLRQSSQRNSAEAEPFTGISPGLS